MYDQEPLFDHALDTYKERMDWIINPQHGAIWDQASFADALAIWIRTASFPIYCHSELSSSEVRHLEQHLYIPCYYWYHAFIARYWYNYWQYHHALTVRDKSHAPYRFLLYARDFSGSRQYRKQMVSRLYRHKDKIMYNWQAQNTVSSHYSALIDTEHANQTGIHLVAETLFNVDKIHLTEKVFKPMVMGQPFIIWGPPGTLTYLKSYGFQTFDQVWSEAYDRETDHEQRMLMLVQLIDQLAALSDDQYQQMYQKCLPMIEHNRKRFYSSTFMDFCWQELDGNWQQALTQRHSLLEQHPGGHLFYIMSNNADFMQIPALSSMLYRFLDQFDAERRARVLRYYPQLIS